MNLMHYGENHYPQMFAFAFVDGALLIAIQYTLNVEYIY